MELFTNTRTRANKRIWIVYSHIYDFIQQFYTYKVG
jgi:hypothetical protein